MKKYIFIIILFLIFGFTSVNANDLKNEVKFSGCVDGDTANFILNNQEIKVRFLAIDTPETNHPTKGVESFGKEASEFTCNALKGAKKIVLEYDQNSDLKDKYDRYLAWVWIDGELLQTKLIENGLAEVAYLYDDYKYVDILTSAQDTSKSKKIGIWNDTKKLEDKSILSREDIPYIIIGAIIIIISLIFSKSYRKKAIKKVKKEIENFLL